jgi:hypothetical protein
MKKARLSGPLDLEHLIAKLLFGCVGRCGLLLLGPDFCQSRARLLKMPRGVLASLYGHAKRPPPIVGGSLIVILQGTIKICSKAHGSTPSS